MKRALLLTGFLLTALLVGVHTAGAHGEHVSPGVEGQFSTTCGEGHSSHHSMDDPIVFPGQPGAAHMHEFFGNNSTDAFSTQASMLGATSDCNFKPDTAGYWVPALMRPNGTIEEATNHWVYYRDFEDQGPNGDVMRPFPAGLKIITDRFYWRCGPTDSQGLIDCPTGSKLTFEASFPSCWDGVNLDSANHRSHMSFNRVLGADGRFHCPASHPVRVPSMSVFGLWWNRPDGTSLDGFDFKANGYRLSSDTGTQQGESMHADFWNTWDQSQLERITQTCLIDHGDIPESPNATINGIEYDPSCKQADSKFVTTTTSATPTPTTTATPPPTTTSTPPPVPTVTQTVTSTVTQTVTQPPVTVTQTQTVTPDLCVVGDGSQTVTVTACAE